jgi:hypothetical protein
LPGVHARHGPISDRLVPTRSSKPGQYEAKEFFHARVPGLYQTPMADRQRELSYGFSESPLFHP